MKNLTLINSSGQEVTINVDNEDVMSMVRADVKKGDLKLVGKATLPDSADDEDDNDLMSHTKAQLVEMALAKADDSDAEAEVRRMNKAELVEFLTEDDEPGDDGDSPS